MKHPHVVALLVLTVALGLALTGCGVPQDKHDKIVVDLELAQNHHKAVQAELTQVKRALGASRSNLIKANDKIEALNKRVKALEKQLAGPKKRAAKPE